MPIVGNGIKDANFRLRFFVLVFMGILAVVSVFYWRSKELLSAQYVELPQHKNDLQKYEDGKLQSKNYQIEVKDTSPTVQ